MSVFLDSYLSHTNQLILECKVHGTPNPVVTWTKDGRPLVESERYSIVDHRDGSRQLIVHQPTLTDNATYTCVATNSVRTTKNSLTVDITKELQSYERKHKRDAESDSDEEVLSTSFKHKLMFETFLKNVTVEEGRSTKFICSVKGSVSDRQVKWLKDGKPVDFDSSNRCVSSFNSGLIIFEITTTKRSDSGEYTCVVQKGSSEIATTAKLYVFTPTVDQKHVPPSFTRSLTGIFVSSIFRIFYLTISFHLMCRIV